MLWCQGAQNIGVFNYKFKYALKCTVLWSQCMTVPDRQTNRQTDGRTSSHRTLKRLNVGLLVRHGGISGAAPKLMSYPRHVPYVHVTPLYWQVPLHNVYSLNWRPFWFIYLQVDILVPCRKRTKNSCYQTYKYSFTSKYTKMLLGPGLRYRPPHCGSSQCSPDLLDGLGCHLLAKRGMGIRKRRG